jgi:hypothetical protein
MLHAWHVDDATIDQTLASLPAEPVDAPVTSGTPKEHAVALAAKMRHDGRADDFIRDALRACDVSEADIDTILAEAPPAGPPISHEIPPETAPAKSEFDYFIDWLNTPLIPI